MNILQLKTEYAANAARYGLNVDCPMDGDVNSNIAIIAEYPGDAEVSMSSPLVGPTGRMLWDSLRKTGITRNKCYITNVCKRLIGQVPAGREETSYWISLLKWELAQLPNIKYVFLLGNGALYAMLGETGIDHWRGSCLQRDGIWYIISNNPANALRKPELEVIFKLDCDKLKRVMDGKWQEYKINALINPSPSEAIRFINKLQDENTPTALDIETMGGETACVGLGNDPHEGMCINFRDREAHRFSVWDEGCVRQRIQRFTADQRTRLVTQNGNFDGYWLWYKDRIRLRAVWFDTLLAHHTLYPTLPHSLGFLTAQYTDHPYYKDDGKAWKEGGDIDTFWRYNVTDVCITLAVQRRLSAELEAQGLATFFHDHVMRAHPWISRMTVHGVKVDTKKKEEISLQLKGDVLRLEEEFHVLVKEATGNEERINPRSPPAMQRLFYDTLGLHGKRGSNSTDKNNKDYMLRSTTDPLKKAIVLKHTELGKEFKFLSTYALSKIDEDERVRSEFKQFGTQSAPGRLSSAANMWDSGFNMQNQPERARGMFIADPGYVFCYFDLGQAEARYVGWLAGIDKWVEDFERARMDGSFDAHRSLAADLFKKPYDEVPKSDYNPDGTFSIRYLAKRARHGLNYRMMAPRLAEAAKISSWMAEDVFYKYHRINPELRQWWQREIEEAKTTHKLYNAFGRRLIILGRIEDDSQLDSIVAFKPQSSIGDKVVQVTYQCQEDPRWPVDARVVLNVHDALIAITKPHLAKTVLRIMKEYAELPVPVTPPNGKQYPPLIIPADCKISTPDARGLHSINKESLKAVEW